LRKVINLKEEVNNLMIISAKSEENDMYGENIRHIEEYWKMAGLAENNG
jgi:hypothetical protein